MYYIPEIVFFITIILGFISFFVGIAVILHNKNYNKEKTITFSLKWFVNMFYITFFILLLFLPKGTNYIAEYSYYNFVLFKSIVGCFKAENYAYFANILVGLSIFTMITFNFNKLPLGLKVIISISIAFFVKVIQALINIITRYPNRMIDIDTFILYLIGILIAVLFVYMLRVLIKIKNNILS